MLKCFLLEIIMKLVRKPTAQRAFKLPYPKWKDFFLEEGRFSPKMKRCGKHFYTFLITCFVLFLRKHKKNKLSLVLGAFLLEPLICFRKVYDHLKGIKNDYSEYGLNPKFLKDHHFQKSPILFLQGRQGNQIPFDW